MKRVAIALLLVMTACAGPPGPQGPSGPQGDAGNPGAGATGRLVWRDSTGALVGYDERLYQDGTGLLWSLDVETARPDATPTLTYYAAAGCAGAAHVVPPPVGIPLRLGTAWVRRPAGLQSAPFLTASARTAAGACVAFSFQGNMVSADTLTPGVAEPSWPFVPPLAVGRDP